MREREPTASSLGPTTLSLSRFLHFQNTPLLSPNRPPLTSIYMSTPSSISHLKLTTHHLNYLNGRNPKVFLWLLESLCQILTSKFPKSRRKRNMSFAVNRITICAAVSEASPPALETRTKPGNLYQVLRVKQNASQVEIKTAYRTLAKIYHPDVAPVAAKHPEESLDGCDFIEIHKAYSTLSDPDSRAVYDLTLTIGSQPQPLGVNYSAPGGFRRHAGFYATRRWETDQCW